MSGGAFENWFALQSCNEDGQPVLLERVPVDHLEAARLEALLNASHRSAGEPAYVNPVIVLSVLAEE